MTTITVELLPCPFCGERPELEKVGRDWWRIKHPHVIECLLDSIEFDYPQSDEDLACGAGDWNRRALLAEHPQAGAGQAEIAAERSPNEWFALVMNAAAELEDAANCLHDTEAKQKAIGAASYYRMQANSAPQPAARQEHGDEVRRLREALTTAANRLDRLTLEVPGGYWREQAAEWTAETRAALTQSPKGEEE